MEEKFLSVSEFAEVAGVSKQNIYQRLKTTLKAYCKEDNSGNKVISAKALELFESGAESSLSSLEQLKAKLEQDLKKTLEQDLLKTLQKEREENNAKIEQLKADFEAEKRAAEAQTSQLLQMLQKELETKNEQIAALNSRLSEAQQNLNQEQQLRAIESKRLIELEQKEEEAAQNETEKKKKASFLDFFKKK